MAKWNWELRGWVLRWSRWLDEKEEVEKIVIIDTWMGYLINYTIVARQINELSSSVPWRDIIHEIAKENW